MGLPCHLPNSRVLVLPLRMWGISERVFKEVIRVKGSPWGEPQSSVTGVLLRRGDQAVDTRKDVLWTGQVGGRLHAEERGFQRNQPCRQLGHGLPTARTVRKTLLLVKPPRLGCSSPGSVITLAVRSLRTRTRFPPLCGPRFHSRTQHTGV